MSPASAIRALILSNELAHSRTRLRQLVDWLRAIVDDFTAHGVDVNELRWEIRRLERELRRRAGLLLVVAGLAACGTGPADNPYNLNVRITSSQPASQCIIDVTYSSPPGDTALRATLHIWFGADGATQSDVAFHQRLGESVAKGLARDGSSQPAKWEIDVVRPLPGFSDPSSPNFGMSDHVWGKRGDGGDYNRLNYTCGQTFNGI